MGIGSGGAAGDGLNFNMLGFSGSHFHPTEFFPKLKPWSLSGFSSGPLPLPLPSSRNWSLRGEVSFSTDCQAVFG